MPEYIEKNQREESVAAKAEVNKKTIGPKYQSLEDIKKTVQNNRREKKSSETETVETKTDVTTPGSEKTAPISDTNEDWGIKKKLLEVDSIPNKNEQSEFSKEQRSQINNTYFDWIFNKLLNNNMQATITPEMSNLMEQDKGLIGTAITMESKYIENGSRIISIVKRSESGVSSYILEQKKDMSYDLSFGGTIKELPIKNLQPDELKSVLGNFIDRASVMQKVIHQERTQQLRNTSRLAQVQDSKDADSLLETGLKSLNA